MDILLTLLGFLFIVTGILGAILPILPGPPISWLGVFCIFGTNAVPNDTQFIWITFIIAISVTILDYIIPIIGTKKFGGTKKGIWGSTLGLLIGLFFGPIGIIFGPFIGAFLGELVEDSSNISKAFNAAIGSLIGFLLSSGIKLTVTTLYGYYFLKQIWIYKAEIFGW